MCFFSVCQLIRRKLSRCQITERHLSPVHPSRPAAQRSSTCCTSITAASMKYTWIRSVCLCVCVCVCVCVCADTHLSSGLFITFHIFFIVSFQFHVWCPQFYVSCHANGVSAYVKRIIRLSQPLPQLTHHRFILCILHRLSAQFLLLKQISLSLSDKLKDTCWTPTNRRKPHYLTSAPGLQCITISC